MPSIRRRAATSARTGSSPARGIGSEVGFAKSYFTAQTFHVVPHTNRIVFAANARLGLAAGFPQESIDRPPDRPVVIRDYLPPSERFFAGGDTTVRGFALDTSARATCRRSRTTRSIRICCRSAATASSSSTRSCACRCPAGSASSDSSTPATCSRTSPTSISAELRSAVGFGIRYKSPIGPIRVDLGFKVNRQPGESLTAWFISFGQAF